MLVRGKEWLKACGRNAVDLLFPPICLACNSELESESDWGGLCEACLKLIPPIRWSVCKKCAARVPDMPEEMEACARCQNPDLKFDQTVSLGEYDELLRDLILRMKQDSSEILAKMFALLFINRSGVVLKELGVDLIVPIPMPTFRRWSRGTNPPSAIARHLGNQLGIEVQDRILRKKLDASPQLGLSSAGRFRNIRGQMYLPAGYSLEAKHVLLVDDAMTTGATCSEAARILKRSGAARVTVLVVARTPNT